MQTKLCAKGNHEVSITLFRKRSAAKDGLQSWCNTCLAVYEAERYQNGDRARKERNRQLQKERTRELLWELLCNSQCKNCGNPDPEVLEFDHRDPSEKNFNVSEMIGVNSWKKILEEIAKCDILCANCHKKRTIRQFGSWRGNMEVSVSVG
jgi:hypothetical protein